MKNNRKIALVVTLSTMLLAACGDLSVEDSSQKGMGDEVVREDVAESENQEKTVVNSKDEYLNMLNAMEEADKNEAAKTTTVDMIEQEEARYKRWDQALNEIYEALKSRLSEEEMGKLRLEQLDWIESRDVNAKEASLKYEGGSMEPLEYVATQASLTKDRCYELVASYMK